MEIRNLFEMITEQANFVQLLKMRKKDPK